MLGPEREPGPRVVTEDAQQAYVRATASTIFHPVATCAMGAGEDGVVDGEHRVRGVEGLRVVDASVMLTVPGCNTNGPTIMVAQRAADMIRGPDPPPAGC